MGQDRQAVNKRQQEFYDKKQKNLPTRIWSYFRNGLLKRLRKEIGVEKDIYDLHRSWFGNLAEKKVLDLGCYEGNSLTMYLAQNSKSYLGIDLSPKGIEYLNRRLKDLPTAQAEVRDFLSDDFREKDFDLIYAYGVLHHFKDVDGLILKLNEKLAAGGKIISHDPMETSPPIRAARKIYRPFQSDRDWEWPFSEEVFYKFEKAFNVLERRAVLGKTKWLPLLNLLPGTNLRKIQRAKEWHRMDWEQSSVDDKYMFSCMQLSMLMQKKK